MNFSKLDRVPVPETEKKYLRLIVEDKGIKYLVRAELKLIEKNLWEVDVLFVPPPIRFRGHGTAIANTLVETAKKENLRCLAEPRKLARTNKGFIGVYKKILSRTGFWEGSTGAWYCGK